MTVGAPTAAVAPPGQPDRAARNRSKLDLWICWWVLPFFYTLFGVIFVLLTRVMPPPSPPSANSSPPPQPATPEPTSSCTTKSKNTQALHELLRYVRSPEPGRRSPTGC